MEKKKKIIIGLVIIAVAAILFLIIITNKKEEAALDNNADKITTNTSKPVAKKELPKPNRKELLSLQREEIEINEKSLEEDNLKVVAKNFVERWGSFSNHSTYDNFKSLKPLMTEEMKNWSDNYVAKLKKKFAGAPFYGVTTKNLLIEIEEMHTQSARVKAVCQKREMKEEIIDVVYENFAINLVKEGGYWKVSGIYQ